MTSRDSAARPRVFVGSSSEGLEVARALQYQLSADADVVLWNEGVPEFFKSELARVDHSIDFVIADYTKYVELPQSYYDLAFCDFVLHKCMWSKDTPDPEMETRYILGQMARSVRPGGFISAYELVRSGLNPPIDLRGLFEQTSLQVKYIRNFQIDNWRGKGQVVALIAEKST